MPFGDGNRVVTAVRCARQDFRIAPQADNSDLGVRMRSALAVELQTAEQVGGNEGGSSACTFYYTADTAADEAEALVRLQRCSAEISEQSKQLTSSCDMNRWSCWAVTSRGSALQS